MAYLAVNKNGRELIFQELPERSQWGLFWKIAEDTDKIYRQCISIPKGSIFKLIGRELTWEDEPVKLTN